MWKLNVELLPSSFENLIITNEGEPDEIIVRSNIDGPEAAKKWLLEFEELNNLQYFVSHARKSLKKKVCSQLYLCQHSARGKVNKDDNKRGISINTSCGAYIRMEVKIVTSNTKRKDPYLAKGLMGLIKIGTKHSHSLDSEEALRYLKPISDEIKEIFVKNYFESGMGISAAIREHRDVYLAGCDEKKYASARTNPPYRVVQNWYHRWRAEKFGPGSGEDLFQKMKEQISEYEKEGHSVVYKKKPFVLLIVSDIMKRAHTLLSAKDVVFMDSTNISCDNSENHSITIILTQCVAGAVPLAVLITKGQSEKEFSNGLELLNKWLGAEGFAKQRYPTVVMTDNCAAQMNAIKTVWPRSINLLCTFHVLQHVWRWLCDKNHCVNTKDRRSLMTNFEMILYCTEEDDAKNAFETAKILGQQYVLWVQYLDDQWAKREKWCYAYRRHITEGNNTSHYAESIVCIFKDLVLERFKTFNLVSLVDSVVHTMNEVYRQRIYNFAYSKSANAHLLFNNMAQKAFNIKKEDIQQINENEFLIPSKTETGKFYRVDGRIFVCECSRNLDGHICKHLFAVALFFNLENNTLPPAITAADRHSMVYLASGQKTLNNNDIFEPLHTNTTSETLLQSCPSNSARENENQMTLSNNSLDDLQSNGSPNDLQSDGPPDDLQSNGPPHDLQSNGLPDEHSTVQSHDTNGDVLPNILSLIAELNNKFETQSSREGLRKFKARLKNVTSAEQWATLLHTAASSMPRRRKRDRINMVQPHLIARRKRLRQAGYRVQKVGNFEILSLDVQSEQA